MSGAFSFEDGTQFTNFPYEPDVGSTPIDEPFRVSYPQEAVDSFGVTVMLINPPPEWRWVFTWSGLSQAEYETISPFIVARRGLLYTNPFDTTFFYLVRMVEDVTEVSVNHGFVNVNIGLETLSKIYSP